MSKSNPTISVVMPVYNSAKYLSSSIESILNQTFSNFELIIIDDSSTDSTSQIIKKYIKLDKRIITVKNKTNLGICNSLNTGLRLAKGKYFDVTSLSGGEQTMVALSLLFAIQEYKPYHFYIFDEISVI